MEEADLEEYFSRGIGVRGMLVQILSDVRLLHGCVRVYHKGVSKLSERALWRWVLNRQ